MLADAVFRYVEAVNMIRVNFRDDLGILVGAVQACLFAQACLSGSGRTDKCPLAKAVLGSVLHDTALAIAAIFVRLAVLCHIVSEDMLGIDIGHIACYAAVGIADDAVVLMVVLLRALVGKDKRLQRGSLCTFCNVKSKAKVIIGQSGIIDGDINCKSIEIEGNVKANITVSDLLSLKSTANLVGNILAGKLAIEPGANFAGNCKMQGMKTDIHPNPANENKPQ